VRVTSGTATSLTLSANSAAKRSRNIGVNGSAVGGRWCACNATVVRVQSVTSRSAAFPHSGGGAWKTRVAPLDCRERALSRRASCTPGPRCQRKRAAAVEPHVTRHLFEHKWCTRSKTVGGRSTSAARVYVPCVGLRTGTEQRFCTVNRSSPWGESAMPYPTAQNRARYVPAWDICARHILCEAEYGDSGHAPPPPPAQGRAGTVRAVNAPQAARCTCVPESVTSAGLGDQESIAACRTWNVRPRPDGSGARGPTPLVKSSARWARYLKPFASWLTQSICRVAVSMNTSLRSVSILDDRVRVPESSPVGCDTCNARRSATGF
jgi:hypothetical protein